LIITKLSEESIIKSNQSIMFKKFQKLIKKDFQRRYEQLEDRFLKFETRLYSSLEERMARLENQFDELSNLIKDSMAADEQETEVKAEATAAQAEEKVEATETTVEEKKAKKKSKSPKKTEAKKTSTKKEAPKAEAKKTAKADDLKVLKGIGPALEKQLKAAGISSIAQMAELTDNDIEALDAKVSGFKQRYERYDWRSQAKAALEQ
jgi:predicted flap endonuclease-1-like 5' DNA nuclease